MGLKAAVNGRFGIAPTPWALVARAVDNECPKFVYRFGLVGMKGLSPQMDRYQNWTSSILNIMEEMSAVSSDDSEKVVDLLRSKAEGEQTWLNRIIEDIKYKYMDSQYKCLSVMDACQVALAKKW